jgi:outer membrane immunogenic protein
MQPAFRCVVLALGLSSATVVHAQPAGWQGLYGGVGLTRAAYKEEGFPTAYPMVLSGRIGKQFTPNFAVEGRLGFGVTDDDVDVGGVPVNLEIDYYFGVYGKGILPLSSQASVYGLIGITQAKLTASAGGFSVTDSDNDLSYGIGGEFAFSQTVSATLEWARLLKGDGYKIDGISIAVNFKF